MRSSKPNPSRVRFGEAAYDLAISATKSMTGHLLGAAGAMEAFIAAYAIRDQIAPPTINYHTPDPDCDLDYIPNTARKFAIATVMTNSMGFGGHNVSLILTAPIMKKRPGELPRPSKYLRTRRRTQDSDSKAIEISAKLPAI